MEDKYIFRWLCVALLVVPVLLVAVHPACLLGWLLFIPVVKLHYKAKRDINHVDDTFAADFSWTFWALMECRETRGTVLYLSAMILLTIVLTLMGF